MKISLTERKFSFDDRDSFDKFNLTFFDKLKILIGVTPTKLSTQEFLKEDDSKEANLNDFGMVDLLLFAFYIINYFVIVFFNVGLVYCAKRILDGEKTSVGEGINFAFSRISTIFAWALLAATVGIILKTIQERAGAIGGVITGLIGMVWGIATFFVVPVIAFEDVSPIQAVKRSGQIIKEKWGESLGANFSFGLFSILGLFLVAIPAGFITGAVIHPIAGIGLGIIVFLIIQTAVSAANMIFLTAAYEHVNDNRSNDYFDDDLLDDMFVKN